MKDIFIKLIGNYTKDEVLQSEFWMEIEKNYSKKVRYYHNLTHLENLCEKIYEVKSEVKNWETILFSLFYHDVVYNILKSDNEERSAKLAVKRMHQLSIDSVHIESCKQQILVTKSHMESQDTDSNFFTDADLSILGLDWEVYSEYCKSIRKEYSIYPDLVYNPGRVKVLQHFLKMNRIYKTDHFYYKFESQARLNMERELEKLKGNAS